MKYQRLSVLTRQLAAVIINSNPYYNGEPIKPEEVFKTVFDEVAPPLIIEYTPEAWRHEQKRLNDTFNKFENGKS